MSRPLGTAFASLVTAREAGEVIATLLTIDHPALAGPLRLVDVMHERVATTDDEIIYGLSQPGSGLIHQFAPFRLDLHSDTPDSPPEAALIVPNIDRAVVDLCRAVVFPRPTARIEIVRAETPETVEVAFPIMEIASAEYDAQAARLSLGMRGFGGEPFPAHSFTPRIAPGLF